MVGSRLTTFFYSMINFFLVVESTVSLCLCVVYTAEIGSGVVPGQLSVDGGQQLRLDLHDAGNRRTFRQHSFPCQDHVGKLVVVTFLFSFLFFLDSLLQSIE